FNNPFFTKVSTRSASSLRVGSSCDRARSCSICSIDSQSSAVAFKILHIRRSILIFCYKHLLRCRSVGDRSARHLRYNCVPTATRVASDRLLGLVTLTSLSIGRMVMGINYWIIRENLDRPNCLLLAQRGNKIVARALPQKHER